MALVGNGAELEVDEDIFEDALETLSVSRSSASPFALITGHEDGYLKTSSIGQNLVC